MALSLRGNKKKLQGKAAGEIPAKFRKQKATTKIIVMSGQLTTTILENNIPDAFLRKPFIPPTLLTCVQRVLTASYKGACEELTVNVSRI